MGVPKLLEWKKLKSDGWLIVVKQNKKIHIFIIKYSTRKGKKYDVFQLNKEGNKLDYVLSFGSSKYQHYYDKLKGYSELDHKNGKRRELYYKRHGSHNNDIYSAKFFSHALLW